MKSYFFSDGHNRVVEDTLNAQQIKEEEKLHGDLIKVYIKDEHIKGIVPVFDPQRIRRNHYHARSYVES